MMKKILIALIVPVILIIFLIFFESPSSTDTLYIKTTFLPSICENIKNSYQLSYNEEILKFTILPKYKNCEDFANSTHIIGGVTSELPDPSKFVAELKISNFNYFIEIQKKGDSSFTMLGVGAREYEAPFYNKNGEVKKY